MVLFLTRSVTIGLAVLVFALGTLISGPTRAEGPILLTVTGNIEKPNRGGYDPALDKFFGYSEVQFSKARQFDYQALRALKSVTIKADFPKGRTIHEYMGPLLVDVLEAAGAKGDMITVRALDGYSIEAPLQELVDQGAVVALSRDGVPFAIGDFGPTQIVFPRAEREELKDMSDDRWVWSIFHILVE